MMWHYEESGQRCEHTSRTEHGYRLDCDQPATWTCDDAVPWRLCDDHLAAVGQPTALAS